MEKFELQQFSELASGGYTIIDTRQPEIFAEGFIEESISIEWDVNFIHAYQELIEDDQNVLLVAEEQTLPAIMEGIRLSGISNIQGYLHGGFDGWKKAGNKTDLLITIEGDEFAMDYQYDEFYLVDTRDKTDFEKEHVEDAENITLNDLESILIEMDTDASYYVYGNTPATAITAGSLFRKNGFQRVRVVAAAYESIKTVKVPFFIQKKKQNTPPGSANN